MAEDAAAPGELSESTATEETSGAAEPEAGGSEVSDAAVTEEKAADSEASDEPAPPHRPRVSHVRLAVIAGSFWRSEPAAVLRGLTYSCPPTAADRSLSAWNSA